MEIDSFYQNGDMSFGMDGRIAFADEAQYLRATGGGGSRSEQVKSWYPDSKDCTELENLIAKARTDVSNNSLKLANPKLKRGEKRVLNDYNNLINGRIAELEDMYRRQGCALKKKQAEESSFMTTIQNLANPQLAGAASGGGSTDDKKKKQQQMMLMVGTALVLVTLSVLAVKYVRQ
jgi:hypothetical protein